MSYLFVLISLAVINCLKKQTSILFLFSIVFMQCIDFHSDIYLLSSNLSFIALFFLALLRQKARSLLWDFSSNWQFNYQLFSLYGLPWELCHSKNFVIGRGKFPNSASNLVTSFETQMLLVKIWIDDYGICFHTKTIDTAKKITMN